MLSPDGAYRRSISLSRFCTALLGGARKLIARPCRVVLACLLHSLAVLYPLAFCTALSGGVRLLFAQPCRVALACFLHGLVAWRSHTFCTASSRGARILFARPRRVALACFLHSLARAVPACFLHGLVAWRSHAFCTVTSRGARMPFAQPCRAAFACFLHSLARAVFIYSIYPAAIAPPRARPIRLTLRSGPCELVEPVGRAHYQQHILSPNDILGLGRGVHRPPALHIATTFIP